jgi:hypothetical protein
MRPFRVAICCCCRFFSIFEAFHTARRTAGSAAETAIVPRLRTFFRVSTSAFLLEDRALVFKEIYTNVRFSFGHP